MTYHSKDIVTYRKTHTLKQTGLQFKMSPERVRQICLEMGFQKRCKRHDRLYYNTCSHCSVENYEQLLEKFGYDEICDEADRESMNRKRDYISVSKRIYLIKCLINRFGISFTEIGRMLKRHPTTINYLYYANS